MSRLPPFDVVVWVKKTDDFPELRDALIGLAVAEPDQSTDYQGMVDFHGALRPTPRLTVSRRLSPCCATGRRSFCCGSRIWRTRAPPSPSKTRAMFEIDPNGRPVALPATTSSHVPALVQAAGERAQTRFLEFFAANIRNPHTRRAYGRAVGEFLAWCEERGVASIVDVRRCMSAPMSRRSPAPQRADRQAAPGRASACCSIGW